MRTGWILATVLALGVAPAAWTQARERTEQSGRDGAERRSAVTRHPAATKSPPEKKASASSDHGKREHRPTKATPHRSEPTRRSGSRPSAHRDSDRGRDYRDGKRVSRHVRRDDHGPRRSYHRAPRYRWVHRSIHIHPTFLPRHRHGYFWSGGYYYPRYYLDVQVHPERASLRVLADPPDAEVYVDGYYAGIVDDFDGIFQRLYVAPGRHEITLRLHGFVTWSAQIYAAPHSTLKIHHDLVPGFTTEADVETLEPGAEGPVY